MKPSGAWGIATRKTPGRKNKSGRLDNPPARGIMNIERAPRQAGSAQCTGYKQKPMNPSLGRVAGSTLYSDRYCPKKNMERQCNRHGLTPFRVVWLNSPAACLGALPLARQFHFIPQSAFCQTLSFPLRHFWSRWPEVAGAFYLQWKIFLGNSISDPDKRSLFVLGI